MQQNKPGRKITPEHRKKLLAGTGASEESILATEAIYNHMKSNKITVASVCKALGYNETSMCRIMNLYRPINLTKAVRICRHLGISMDEIFGIVPKQTIN